MSGVINARRALLRLLLVLAVACVGAVGLTTVNAAPAQALCASSPLTGSWHNIDSSTRAMTRVDVGFVCGDVVLCDTNGNCTGGQSYFTIRAFGKCSPTDCDWGTRRATDMGGGWQRGTWSYSWATKYVWVKTYVYGTTTYLRVWTYTDFTTADGRTDYTTDEWMLK